jgi:ATP phosphoribosyltransferase
LRKEKQKIRIALPSKGIMAKDTLSLLDKAGLEVLRPNPRQYKATLPAMPEISVIFQRPGDIALSVQDGIVDFGITGLDIVSEKRDPQHQILIMLDALDFGGCRLCAIVPEGANDVNSMADLPKLKSSQQDALRVATKFPNLTKAFFKAHGIQNVTFIQPEGALEIAPLIGYADMITDLVSTGTTLRDNRLKILNDGLILKSQACLVANRDNLKKNPDVMAAAKQLLEFIVAHLRAKRNVAVFANIRGDSAEAVAVKILNQEIIRGLQGPTISRVITHKGENWYAAHLIVPKNKLASAIRELREIGGSGVVVTPVSYIFEEEPEAYQKMVMALKGE